MPRVGLGFEPDADDEDEDHLIKPLIAHGAGSIYYGSRAGMEVTVVGVSGIGTTHAVVGVKHPRENARTFCTEYANDKSEACIDRTLRETRLNDQLEGNCDRLVHLIIWRTIAVHRRSQTPR
jgi:hypothetical protein